MPRIETWRARSHSVASEREVSGRRTCQLLLRQGEEESPFGLGVIVLTAQHMDSALNPQPKKVLSGVGDSTRRRMRNICSEVGVG